MFVMPAPGAVRSTNEPVRAVLLILLYLVYFAIFTALDTSAVARRLPELEALLKGRRMDASLPSLVEAQHLACLDPISDVRGTAQYRRDAALELVGRAIAKLTEAR